jgi:hypothetical protein
MNIVTIIVDNDNKTVTLDSLKGDKWYGKEYWKSSRFIT